MPPRVTSVAKERQSRATRCRWTGSHVSDAADGKLAAIAVVDVDGEQVISGIAAQSSRTWRSVPSGERLTPRHAARLRGRGVRDEPPETGSIASSVAPDRHDERAIPERSRPAQGAGDQEPRRASASMSRDKHASARGSAPSPPSCAVTLAEDRSVRPESLGRTDWRPAVERCRDVARSGPRGSWRRRQDRALHRTGRSGTGRRAARRSSGSISLDIGATKTAHERGTAGTPSLPRLLPSSRAASATGRSSRTTNTRTARWLAGERAGAPRSIAMRSSIAAAALTVDGIVDLSKLNPDLPALVALERSEVIGELVAGDAAQPGDSVGSTVEAGALVDRGDERLLGQLFGESGIAGASTQQVARTPAATSGDATLRTIGRRRGRTASSFDRHSTVAARRLIGLPGSVAAEPTPRASRRRMPASSGSSSPTCPRKVPSALNIPESAPIAPSPSTRMKFPWETSTSLVRSPGTGNCSCQLKSAADAHARSGAVGTQAP